MAPGGPGQHRTLPAQHWKQPFLHFNHAGKQDSWPCFQEKSEVWIFMYNILILILETKFFFQKKKKKTVGMKSPQQYAGISLQSLQVFISRLQLAV